MFRKFLRILCIPFIATVTVHIVTYHLQLNVPKLVSCFSPYSLPCFCSSGFVQHGGFEHISACSWIGPRIYFWIRFNSRTDLLTVFQRRTVSCYAVFPFGNRIHWSFNAWIGLISEVSNFIRRVASRFTSMSKLTCQVTLRFKIWCLSERLLLHGMTTSIRKLVKGASTWRQNPWAVMVYLMFYIFLVLGRIQHHWCNSPSSY